MITLTPPPVTLGAATEPDALAALFTQEDIQQLMDLCLVAAMRGDTRRTDAIAAGLRALRPTRAAPVIARALVRLSNGRAKDAADLMRDAPPGEDDEEFQFRQGMLGLALHIAGRRAEAGAVIDASARHDEGWLARHLQSTALRGVRS